MLRDTSSSLTPTSSRNARRISNNNPFRGISTEAGGLLEKDQSDLGFNSWVLGNRGSSKADKVEELMTGIGVEDNNVKNDVANSSHSDKRDYRMRKPPMRPASNNPFLDDLESGSSSKTYDFTEEAQNWKKDTNGYERPETITRERGERYRSAREEKEDLRRAYMEERKVSDRHCHEEDLPPSYEEVAGSKQRYSRKEKLPGRFTGASSDVKSQKLAHGQVSSRSTGRSRTSGPHHPGERSEKKSHHYRATGDRKQHSSSTKDKNGSTKHVPENVDTIDKLDVTGLFGGAFHHDGPFDACTPHRNQNKKVAPVLAFPKDGPNSTLTGVTTAPSARGQVFGIEVDDDSYLYHSIKTSKIAGSSASTLSDGIPKQNVTQFDAKNKADLVHGPTTQGLGSTTFLDGAPAAPAAIEDMNKHSTIGRKKSLNQRLTKGISGDSERRSNLKLTNTHPGHVDFDSGGKGEDDDNDYDNVRGDQDTKKALSGNKFLRRVKSLKVSRRG
ncbi:HBR351Cp [Eremothecium sinecaudum]|uniref:HBR351Cp n=1 Tax=Eremothecium sinecaudum TaxID=45286 RepID=A0A109UY32_9SACH|nr:HBR351Cp [Eremothecium sinecaudum]AMD19252.1 HBR351Cp [Eremothecium sinecaudum]